MNLTEKQREWQDFEDRCQQEMGTSFDHWTDWFCNGTRLTHHDFKGAVLVLVAVDKFGGNSLPSDWENL
jgi:hypothetical protein